MNISQREARRLKRRVAELEGILSNQRKSWASEWPSSVVIGRTIPNETIMAKITTARLLDHAVVVVPQGNEFAYFASVLPKVGKA